MSRPPRKRVPAGRLPPPTKRTIRVEKSLTDDEINEHLDTLFNQKRFKGNSKAILDEMREIKKTNKYFTLPKGTSTTGTRCTKPEDKDYPAVCISKTLPGLKKTEDGIRMFNRFKERLNDRLRAERIVTQKGIAKKKVNPSIPKNVKFKRVGTETFLTIPPSERLPLITTRDEPELVLGTGKVRSSALLGIVSGSARTIPIAEIILSIESKDTVSSGVLGEITGELEKELRKEVEPRDVQTKVKGRAKIRGRQKKQVKLIGSVKR